MKIPGLDKAVFATCGSTHVEPVPIRLREHHGTSVAELWVDRAGSLILKTSDGHSVVVPREAWPVLEKVMGFAKRYS